MKNTRKCIVVAKRQRKQFYHKHINKAVLDARAPK